MGILDRTASFFTGIGGGFKAAGGWAADLATAPFNDDEEFNGFWNTVSGRTMTRLGELAEETIGPDEGLGALIGGLPTGVRTPARSIFEGLDQLGAHAIRRPIATSQILANERDGASWGSRMTAMNPLLWLTGMAGRSPDDIRDAWNASEHISVGQALAFNTSGTSLFDNQQRTEFMGSDLYRYQSGLTDAAFRIFADVDVLAGKGLSATRARVLRNGVRSDDVIRAAYRKYADLADDYPGATGPAAGGPAAGGPGPSPVDMTPTVSPDAPRLGPGGSPVEMPHGAPAMYPGGARARALTEGDFTYRPTFEVGPDGEIVEVSRFRPNVEGRVAAQADDVDQAPGWMLTEQEYSARLGRARNDIFDPDPTPEPWMWEMNQADLERTDDLREYLQGLGIEAPSEQLIEEIGRWQVGAMDEVRAADRLKDGFVFLGSKSTLRGNRVQPSGELAQALRNAPANAPKLYRGVAVTDDFIDSLAPGSTFSIPEVASASETPGYATRFANMRVGDSDVAQRAIVFEIDEGARGLKISGATDLLVEQGEFILSRQTFRVKSVSGGTVKIEPVRPYRAEVDAALARGENVPAEVLLQRDEWARAHLPGRVLDLATDVEGRKGLAAALRNITERARQQLDEPWARRADARKAVDDLDEARRDFDAALAAGDDELMAAAIDRAADAWSTFSPSNEARQLHQMLLDQAGGYRYLREPGRFQIPGDPFQALYTTRLDDVLDQTRRVIARDGGDIDSALAGARAAHKGDVLRAIDARLDVPDHVLARYANDADVARALRMRDRLLTRGESTGTTALEPARPGMADEVFEPGPEDIRGPGETFATDIDAPSGSVGPADTNRPPPPPGNVGKGNKAGPYGHEVSDRAAWLAGRIRGLDFSDHALGAEISYWLARAIDEGGPRAFEQTWRFLAGDVDALVALSRSHDVLAARLSKMFDTDGLMNGAPDILEDARASIQRGNLDEASATAIDALPEEMLLELGERMTFAWKSIQETPTFFLPDAAETLSQKAATVLNTERIRQRAIASELWHSGGIGGRSVRSFFNMRPHHLVDLNSQSADIQLQRMLRDAGLDEDTVATLRGRYQSAFGTANKTGAWDEAEQAAWKHMADQYGVSPNKAQEIAEQISQGKLQTRKVLQRKTTYDGDGRGWVHLDDGLGEAQIPLGRTQMQNTMPVVDFKLVERHLKEYQEVVGRFEGVGKAKAAAEEAASYILDKVGNYWKSAVLLRPGWTMRVVVMDEQLRAMAKFGALTTALDSVRNVRNLTHDYLKHFNLVGDAGVSKAGNIGMVAGGGIGAALGGAPGAIIGGAAGRGIMRRLAQMDEVYRPQLTINGYKVQQAFGAPGDEAELFRRMSSSHQDWVEFIARFETDAADATYRNLSGWDTIAPTDSARYGQSWEWAVNKQLGQDTITIGGVTHEGPALRFMRGQTKAEVAEWLTTTRAGRKYMADIHPLRKKRMQEWLDVVEEQARVYTAGYNPKIVDGILGDGPGTSYDDLVDAIPNVKDRPTVHGQSLEQSLGKGPIQAKVDEWIQEGFTVLGGMPTDRLSRWPTFEKFYEAEMYRLLDDIQPGQVPERVIRQLEGQARTYALEETRRLMYDLAERSEFGEMVRHLSPFFSAWQEVLTRWAGLAVENPAFVARLNKIWNAPEAAGIVYTDDQGDEHLMFRIPERAKSLLGASPLFESALDEQGFVRIPKTSFNMLAQGIPSVGPFVQIPISKVIEAEPQVEDAFQWMFPYGSNPDVLDSFMPAWARRLKSRAGGQDDRAFATAYVRNLQSKLVKIDQGLMEPMSDDELLQMVQQETEAFFSLRAVANFISPVTPIFDSPYAPYIEVYRDLRLQHDDADEKFLEMFGDEFFWLTRSFTKTNDGIPATLPGFEAREKYQGLIEQHPDLGGLILGSEGSGAQVRFSSAMYDRQLTTPIREGSDVMQRERLSPREFLTEGRERAGWEKFVRSMDLIDAARIEAGLPNLKVAAARPLANAKRAIIEQIATQHPEWYRAYSEVDMAKWNDRLIGLWDIVDDSRLSQRPDIQGLQQYLMARELMLEQLEAAPNRSLDAAANAQLAAAWEGVVNTLVERNLAFAELYHRYLERDPMSLDTRRAALTPMRGAA